MDLLFSSAAGISSFAIIVFVIVMGIYLAWLFVTKSK